MYWVIVLVISVLVLSMSLASAAPVASNLHAEYRSGQVFLTWDEAPGLQGSMTVLNSAQPITAANAQQATVIAHHLNPGSAYDWWLNEETYGNPLPKDPVTGLKPPIPHEGFIIKAGAPKLNADSGLHVHTVGADEVGARYYAVISVSPEGAEDWSIAPGANSLAQPVSQQFEAVQAIWQGPGAAPDTSRGKGLAVHLQLHAKTGKGGQEWLIFGDKSLGWREGLPFKTGAAVIGDAVRIVPTDRTWIYRMFPEGTDDCQRLTPAIHSFWYGYNDHIYDKSQMAKGTVVDYTDRRILWLLDWTHRTFGTDLNRVYAYGSSMGGCGDIASCLHHPEIFAAIRAHVPIVAYDKGPGGDSDVRLVKETGGWDTMTNEGMTVRDRLNGTKFVSTYKGDLPFLVITNGRNDTSIPWWKNPDFYRAMRDRHQGMIAAWDEGTHPTCEKDMPADIHAWDNLESFHKLFALNKSYLALTNLSLDNNPGNGDSKDGDPVGFMGRGLTWQEPLDEANRYEVVVLPGPGGDVLPITADVTPRRLQAFKLKPGEKLTATNVEADTGKEVQKITITADDQGLATFTGFQVTSKAGNKLVLTK